MGPRAIAKKKNLRGACDVPQSLAGSMSVTHIVRTFLDESHMALPAGTGIDTVNRAYRIVVPAGQTADEFVSAWIPSLSSLIDAFLEPV